MRHYFAYHNPDTMGFNASELTELVIFTNKNVSKDVIDGRVWLITGEGKPRKYFLVMYFDIESIDSGKTHGFKTKISGSNGQIFNDYISINHCDWLDDFKHSEGNFAFGFKEIIDAQVYEGLPSLISSNPMSISKFYTDVLGSNLRNSRWSWGSYDPISNRVYLRVWFDEFRQIDGMNCVLVVRHDPRRTSHGYSERKEQVDLIRNGASGYGIICKAVDADTSNARKIKSFDNLKLSRFGQIFDVAYSGAS